MRWEGILIPFCLIALSPAAAEDHNGQAEEQDVPPLESVSRQVGQTVTTTNGQVGQRQTRAQATLNIEPLNRIKSRIATRGQNRLHNRVDRYYNPQANAASSFDAADQEIKAAGIAKPQ